MTDVLLQESNCACLIGTKAPSQQAFMHHMIRQRFWSFNSPSKTAITPKYWRENQNVAPFSTTFSKSTLEGSSNLLIIISNNTRVYWYLRKRVPSRDSFRAEACMEFDWLLSAVLICLMQGNFNLYINTRAPIENQPGFCGAKKPQQFSWFFFCGALCTH